MTRLVSRERSAASLLALVVLSAIAGGFYGIRGAEGVPIEYLAGSPFDDYFVPSLILIIPVGGSSLAASIAVYRRAPGGRAASLFAGAVLAVWIVVQVVIIGLVSWLQPVFFALALLIIGISWRLPRNA